MTRTRPAVSSVRHGMASCAEYGCRRPECVRALRRAWSHRRADLSRGIRQTVPALRSAVHLEQLVMAGLSPQDIAERTGLSACAIRRIRRLPGIMIYRSTAEALLGLPVPGQVRSDSFCTVLALGSARRLQALAARGFTLPVVAASLDCSTQTVWGLRSGRRASVRPDTARAIADLYERWWQADPLEHGVPAEGAAKAMTHARRERWAPPGCWDSHALDSAAGFPDWTGACGTPKGYSRHRKNADVPPPCQPCKSAVAASHRADAGLELTV